MGNQLVEKIIDSLINYENDNLSQPHYVRSRPKEPTVTFSPVCESKKYACTGLIFSDNRSVGKFT